MAVTPVDVGGSIAKGLQINVLKDQLQARKDEQAARNQMRALLSGGIPTDQAGRQNFVSQIAPHDPSMALDWGKFFQSQDTAQLERHKAEAPFFVGALEGVRDQSGYQQAVAGLQQRGVDVSDLPPQYDPAQVNMALQGYRYLGGLQPKEAAPSQLNKLIAERDALPEGHPARAIYDDAIKKASTFAPPARTNISVGGEKPSAGQKKLDEKFAETVYLPFVLEGGFADAEKGMEQIQIALGGLREGRGLTGTLRGFLPDTLRASFDQGGLGVQQMVEEVVQRNLRLVLGAQFTEKEGERLIARSYDPRLSEQENAARLERLFTAMADAFNARLDASQYYEDNSMSLSGYRGASAITDANIARRLESALGGGGSGSSAQPAVANEFSGLSEDELLNYPVTKIETAETLAAYKAAMRAKGLIP